MASWKFVGGADGQTMPHVIRRARVELADWGGNGVVLPVIERVTVGVGGGEETPPGKAAAAGGDQAVVVGD